MDYMPFVRLRSDVERKRLFGFAEDENSKSQLDSGIYSTESSVKTYEWLAELSHLILVSQWSVLVDAAFLHPDQRYKFQELAINLGIPFLILHFRAPESILMERIKKRQKTQKDASEADVQVLKKQISRHELPSPLEAPYTIKIDSSNTVDIPKLAQLIQRHLQN